MGMGFTGSQIDTIEEDFVREQCPTEFQELLDSFEGCSEFDGLDDFAKIVADLGLNSEDNMTEPEKKYLALRKAFEQKTGLEIGVFYHDSQEGDRYDDFFGRAWWVDGVYQYTPAGEKYKSKITKKSFVTYG
jgi:hypothetical protein